MHEIKIHSEAINNKMHYLDVYSELCLMIVRTKTKANPNYADLAIIQNEYDKFHFRLIELHDAGKITGVMAMEYVVEIEHELDTIKSLIKNHNNN